MGCKRLNILNEIPVSLSTWHSVATLWTDLKKKQNLLLSFSHVETKVAVERSLLLSWHVAVVVLQDSGHIRRTNWGKSFCSESAVSSNPNMARPYCPTYGNVEHVLHRAAAAHARGLKQICTKMLAGLPKSHTQPIFTTISETYSTYNGSACLPPRRRFGQTRYTLIKYQNKM